eukprot:9479564-Pyramimonas_sp.AAC.2
MDVPLTQITTRPTPPGGCDPRNCRHFRGLQGGPAAARLMQIATRPRRPLGAATCEAVTAFVGFREAQ